MQQTSKPSNVDLGLPQKAKLFAPMAGSAAALRARKEARGDRVEEGSMLLSTRQLRHIDKGRATAISMLEPFQLQLSRWAPSEDAPWVELNVEVRQQSNRITFSVAVPLDALSGPLPPLRQSAAPHMKPEAFVRIWPGLRHFAEVHGRISRTKLDLERLTQQTSERPEHDRIKVERDDTRLRVEIFEQDYLARRLFVSSLSQWLLLPLCWIGGSLVAASPSFASQMDPFGEFPLELAVKFGGIPWLALSLLAWFVVGRLARREVAWLEVDRQGLRTGGKLMGEQQRAVVETNLIEQLYAHRSRSFDKGLAHTLQLITDDGEHHTLLSPLAASDAFYIEAQVEDFLGIHDRPVFAESPEKDAHRTNQEAS